MQYNGGSDTELNGRKIDEGNRQDTGANVSGLGADRHATPPASGRVASVAGPAPQSRVAWNRRRHPRGRGFPPLAAILVIGTVAVCRTSVAHSEGFPVDARLRTRCELTAGELQVDTSLTLDDLNLNVVVAAGDGPAATRGAIAVEVGPLGIGSPTISGFVRQAADPTGDSSHDVGAPGDATVAPGPLDGDEWGLIVTDAASGVLLWTQRSNPQIGFSLRAVNSGRLAADVSLQVGTLEARPLTDRTAWYPAAPFEPTGPVVIAAGQVVYATSSETPPSAKITLVGSASGGARRPRGAAAAVSADARLPVGVEGEIRLRARLAGAGDDFRSWRRDGSSSRRRWEIVADVNPYPWLEAVLALDRRRDATLLIPTGFVPASTVLSGRLSVSPEPVVLALAYEGDRRFDADGAVTTTTTIGTELGAVFPSWRVVASPRERIDPDGHLTFDAVIDARLRTSPLDADLNVVIRPRDDAATPEVNAALAVAARLPGGRFGFDLSVDEILAEPSAVDGATGEPAEAPGRTLTWSVWFEVVEEWSRAEAGG